VLQLQAAFEYTFFLLKDCFITDMMFEKMKWQLLKQNKRIKIYRQYICHNINLLIQCILCYSSSFMTGALFAKCILIIHITWMCQIWA
jgi:hypothetical protein